MDTTPTPASHLSASEYASQLSSSIKGKTVLVLGASTQSLAGTFLVDIAPHGPAQLILAGRSTSKLEEMASAIHAKAPNVPTRNLVIDLQDLASVRTAAEQVNKWEDVPSIDVLLLSAGIMAVDYDTTKDGFERQFGTNHIGPFLFTNLIIQKVLSAQPGGRIVVVSSDGHATSGIRANAEEVMFSGGKTYDRWLSYGQSKSANTLFAKSLAKRFGARGVTAVSLHPGAITDTGLGGHVPHEQWGEFMKITDGVRNTVGEGRRDASTNLHTRRHDWSKGMPFKSVEDGAATYVVAAFDPTLRDTENGGYLQDAKLDSAALESWAGDDKEAERLWSLSEAFVGQKFSD